jgi:hypothetical protein
MKEDNPMPLKADLFRNLFATREFSDRYSDRRDQLPAIDVIIPLLHSNDLWYENLQSIYREIPVNRLLIGDAGATDGSIETLKNFPRVEIIDHKKVATLGKSISLLMSEVETDFFAYLQSDVYLPIGWFEAMMNSSSDFAWIGCPMQVVVLLDYKQDLTGHRPLSGAQLGKRDAFTGIDNFINDDFVYRNEDYVFDSFVRAQGHNSGANHDTFHFHQVSRRITKGDQLDVTGIDITKRIDPNEVKRVLETQVYGIIKYCEPDSQAMISAFDSGVDYLLSNSEIGRRDLRNFCDDFGPAWTPYINRAFKLKRRGFRLASKHLTQIIKKFTTNN